MAISSRRRFEVLHRDGFTCRYCGRRPPGVRLEVDHIQPKSKGGSDDPDNLLAACELCNRGKAALEIVDGDEGAEAKDADLRIRRLTEALENLLQLALLGEGLGMALLRSSHSGWETDHPTRDAIQALARYGDPTSVMFDLVEAVLHVDREPAEAARALIRAHEDVAGDLSELVAAHAPHLLAEAD